MAEPNEEKDIFMDLLSLASIVDDKNEEETAEEDFRLAEDLTDEEVRKIAVVELMKTIGFNNEVLAEIRDMVMMGADAEFAGAFSSISKANSDAIKVISEFALQSARLKNQKDIKKMDIEGKKDVNDHKHQLELKAPTNKAGNNILVMSREDLFDKVFKQKEDIIDVELAQNELETEEDSE